MSDGETTMPAVEANPGGSPGHGRRTFGPRTQALLSNLLFTSRFIPVWIATLLLLIVSAIIAPDALKTASWSYVLPYMTILAIAGIGEMLVIMTGGIDLSIPGVMFLVGNLVLGVSHHSDSRLALAILACIGLGLIVGFSNGVFISVLRLNPLIVTLAVGQIVLAFGVHYSRDVSFESSVPAALSSWALSKPLGISWVFWLGAMLTILVALFLRYTAPGRRFQAVGANSRAAWMSGIHVRTHVIAAYTAAGALYAAAAILLAAERGSIDSSFGSEYLLAPVAAVVIGGASLAGGLASVTSTWVAAFALTLLTELLNVLGLSISMQYVVFGAAILAGMIISGDRIASGLGKLLQQPRIRALFGGEQSAGS